MKSARQTAFEILLRIHRDGAYSNLAVDGALSSEKSLDQRDAAFVSALVYGTLDRIISIDYNLSLYLTQPIKKLRPELLVIMRMGAYQLLFMDKVPVSAAVNESVKLAKDNKSAFAASLVNAVLRKVASNGFCLPEEGNDDFAREEIEYSCPKWMLELWSNAYGRENAVEIARHALLPSSVTVRVNTTKTDAASLISELEKEGTEATESAEVENALVLKNTGSVERLEAYVNGLFHAQDTASQLCCRAVDARPGETVFDMCAAPGGKTFTIAEYMNGEGTVNSFDIYQSRVELIRSGARRLGLDNVKPMLSDGSIFNENYGEADRVLCDVPCSGLGVIGRKPEIRFKKEQELKDLPELQYQILCCARRYLKKGGRLVYSTCTLNPAENQQVCRRFLSECREFKSVPVLPGVDGVRDGDFLTMLPHLTHGDGFFVAAFEKKGV